MIGTSLVGYIGLLLYVGFIVFVIYIVWQVVSALRRIGKGVEDIAETLRRTESKAPP
jgi:hypothetical protein